MKTYVIKCPYCGNWQNKQVKSIRKATLKCYYCNKSRKLKQENEIGLSVVAKGPYNGRDAIKVCQSLKQNRNV